MAFAEIFRRQALRRPPPGPESLPPESRNFKIQQNLDISDGNIQILFWFFFKNTMQPGNGFENGSMVC